MRRPPITITCRCGQVAKIPYGETWECADCGRRWNTTQVPVGEYEGILRDMRRARLLVIGVALGVAAVFAVLAVFVSESLFMLAPVVITGWFIVYMPMWRRRLRRRAQDLPQWQLHPE